MSHLYKLGLENFRVFKEFTEIEFAPITILTGANNSGKSSLIKAIQLLQSNFTDKRSDSDLSLSFIYEQSKLSCFDEVINNTSKPLKFVLPLILDGIHENLTLTLSYVRNEENELGEGIISTIEIRNEKNEQIFSYERTGAGPNVWTDFAYFFNKLLEHKKIKEDFATKCQSLQKQYEFSKDENALELHPIYNLSTDIVISSGKPAGKIGFYPYPAIGIDNFEKRSKFNKPVFEKRKNTFYRSGLIDPELFLLMLLSSGIIDLNIWNEKYSEDYFEKTDIENVIISYLTNEAKLARKEISRIRKQFEINILESLNSFKGNIPQGSPFINYFTKHISNFYYTSSKIESDLISSIFNKIPLGKRKKLLSGIIRNDWRTCCLGLEYFLNEYISESLSALFINSSLYFQNVSKLDSVRANTQRIYTYTSQGTEFNKLLLNVLKEKLTSGFGTKEFLNKWFNKFGIEGDLQISNTLPGVGLSVSIGNRPLADLGYGISQLVPILLEIILIDHYVNSNYENAYREPNAGYDYSSVLIIEEPETNLHPKYQSLLADLLVEASKKFRIQFIVETHSEYLIRKLQFLTGKGDIKPVDTSIYYFYHPGEIPKGEKQVKKIEILEDGSLSDDFGTGFFDEALNWKFELLKLKNKN